MRISNFKFPHSEGIPQSGLSNAQSVLWLLVLLIPLVLLVLFAGSVRVKKVSCFTQYGPCPDSYNERLREFVGRMLYSVSNEEAGEKLSSLGAVGEVRVLKHLGGKLEIEVEVEKPRAAVSINGEQKLFLINLNGEIVSQVQTSSLPKLTVRVGKVSPEDSNFVSALRLVELSSRAVAISGAELTGDGLTFNTDGTQVLMPLSGRDPQVLVGSLQLILGRSTIEGKRVSKIDLRFKNAVVTYD